MLMTQSPCYTSRIAFTVKQTGILQSKFSMFDINRIIMQLQIGIKNIDLSI